MATKSKPEKKQHIQVFTRVRPLNSQELRSQIVVECVNSREVSVRDKSQTKTFQFDRVFGPDSKQVDVYKSVVNPLIEEVLQGYNCTVFAYGQTGTGKTFTMVGEKSQDMGKSWEDDPNCGIIPRTLSHLFDELKIRAEEFTVRVSFLELYNEELCDLLAPNDTDDSKSLRLFEDSTKKGSVIVSGLEERTVHNKDDVYAILAAGNLRRQTAPTLMNAQSSRSHTIFTITVHIKVTTPEGEDLIKTGKLNLVDLAGSENIGRSGAVDMRAREAGNINQSLLTLGRVITSLVERTPHVPYRESKLTRILQDSLGGRTKTSIIATVSPALCNIEETLSTFDYAHRARNITNKPEINQKTSKRALIKEYTEEIERLRRDLIAAREKHGVYLAPENYNAIMAERDHLNKELINKLQLLKAREDEKAEQDEMLKRLNDSLNATLNELQKTQKLCDEKENELNEANKEAVQLFEKAIELDSDKNSLHDRLDRSRRIQEHNLQAAEKFKNYICSKFVDTKDRAKKFLAEIVPQIRDKNEFDCKFLTVRENNLSELKNETEEFINNSKNQLQSAMDVYVNQITSLNNFLTEQQESAESNIDSEKLKCEKMKSDFNDFSNNLTAHREMLMGSTTDVVDRLKAQRRNLQEIETNTSGVKSVVIDLPEVIRIKNQKFEERIRLNEENIKALKEQEGDIASKEEEIVRKRADLVEQQARVLNEMKIVDSDLEKIIESRKDLCQRLKSIEKESEDLRKELLEQTLMNIVETTSALNDGLSKTEDIIKNTSDPMDSTIKSIEESIKSIDTMKLIEEESTSKFITSTETTTLQNVEKLQNLIQLIQIKIDEANGNFQNVKNPLSKTFQNLEKHDSNMKQYLVKENTAITNFHNESQSRQQNILSNITEYAEETFWKTHTREKEIKEFFEEGIQKDEKTGSTPQRKEFNYPKRVGILKIKNENEGS